MMGDPSQYVGRIARIIRDGTFVLVENVDCETCEVLAWPLTRPGNQPQVASYEPNELELLTSDEFKQTYPYAQIVEWTPEITVLPIETEIDFSTACFNPVLAHPKPLIIFGPCRITGTPTNKVAYRPAQRRETRIFNSIRVEADNADDIVEFENINFANQVVCARGRILFRTCTFSGRVAKALSVGITETAAEVTLESCTFANNLTSGVVVRNGHVSMFNCSFRDMGVGICVKAGQSLRAQHCTFCTSAGGVLVRSRCEVQLSYCSFLSLSEFAVGVRKNAKVNLTSCLVEECNTENIIVENDPHKHIVVVKCTVSIFVLGGDVNLCGQYCVI